MNTRENGRFTVGGNQASISLPIGETFHTLIVKGNAAALMTLDKLVRGVLYLNDRIIMDFDPRKFLKIDKYKSGRAMGAEYLYIDFTEIDAKDPTSEFQGSIGTMPWSTMPQAMQDAYKDAVGVDVDSFKLVLYGLDETVPLGYLRSWRRVSKGTPLNNKILTLLPYTYSLVTGAGKFEILLPKGANSPHQLKRSWLFERKVGGVDQKKIVGFEVWKNDRLVQQFIRDLNNEDQARYKGIPDDEMQVVDFCGFNYPAQEALDTTDAVDLKIIIETSAATVIDYYNESYTNFAKAG